VEQEADEFSSDSSLDELAEPKVKKTKKVARKNKNSIKRKQEDDEF